ncbi:alpha/beta hydrolase [Desulfovulcanus sp.]
MIEKNIACLLIHGFGGSPFELQGLASILSQAGYFTRLPLLPGHGRELKAFHQTNFNDWALFVEQEYLKLKKEFSRVLVIGFSMGGTLGLYLAQKYQLPGMVSIAAPVFLYRIFPFKGPDWKLPLVPILRYFRKYWPIDPASPQSRQIAPWQGYEGAMALHPLTSLIKGAKKVRQGLPKIKCPILVLHSPQDKTCIVDNAWEIITKVSSPIRSLELLPIKERITSGHLLPTHQETKERVKEIVLNFVNYITKAKE